MRVWFAPPEFSDEEKNQKAFLTLFITWTLLIVMTLGVAVWQMLESGGNWRWLTVLGFIFPVSLIALILNWRGKTRAAGWVVVGGGWVMVSMLAFTSGGVRAAVNTGFFVVISLAWLLLGRITG